MSFYASANGVSAVIACVLLVLMMAIHTYGELVGSAGSWSIGFGLADERIKVSIREFGRSVGV
jgi:hypothetical protein